MERYHFRDLVIECWEIGNFDIRESSEMYASYFAGFRSEGVWTHYGNFYI